MPQLSIETFVTQYVWLLVILLTFYYFNVTKFIPRVSETLKVRELIEQEKEEIAEGTEESLGKSLISSTIKVSEGKNHITSYEENYKKNNQLWVESKI